MNYVSCGWADCCHLGSSAGESGIPTRLKLARPASRCLGLRYADKYLAVSSILALSCGILAFGWLYLARPPVGTYLTTNNATNNALAIWMPWRPPLSRYLACRRDAFFLVALCDGLTNNVKLYSPVHEAGGSVFGPSDDIPVVKDLAVTVIVIS